VRAELQGVLGRLLHNLALGDEAIGVRRQRVAQLQALHADPAELAQAWRELADSQDIRGELPAAAESLRQGLALCRDTGMKPPALCWGLQASLGWQDVLAGKLDQARAQIEPALAQLRQQAPGSAELAEALVYEGDALSNANQPDPAYALYQASMGIRARLWGAQSVRLARERYQLGIGLWSTGRLAQAKRELSQAEQDMAQAMGTDHSNTLAIGLQKSRLDVLVDLNPVSLKKLTNTAQQLIHKQKDIDPRTHYDAEYAWGEALLYSGDLAQAYPHLINALSLANRLEGRLADRAVPELNLAWYAQLTGDFERARTTLLKAIDRLQNAQGSSGPGVRDLLETLEGLNLAEGKPPSNASTSAIELALDRIAQSDPAALMEMGQFARAEPLIRSQAEAVNAKTESDQYQSVRYGAYDRMGRYLANTGQCSAAISWFNLALSTLKNAHVDNPYLMQAHARLGHCLLSTGHRSEAIKHWQLASKRAFAAPKLNPYMLKEVSSLEAAVKSVPP
jgi:tetratricopeptide (TPR) repeat protein